MAQVLGNLGISLTEDIDRTEEHQAPNSSSSNHVFDLPDMEMPSPEGAEQPEAQFDENSPLEKLEHPDDTWNQLPIDQGGEDLEIPFGQKETAEKGNKRIIKLEHENKTLRKRVKKIKVLKQKVRRLKETIRQLKKKLEQANKSMRRINLRGLEYMEDIHFPEGNFTLILLKHKQNFMLLWNQLK
jgi:translation initiation factor 1 (eIF-1/SUI1)